MVTKSHVMTNFPSPFGGKAVISSSPQKLKIHIVYFIQGDSGGPLYMRSIIEGKKKSSYFESSKPWFLLGIVSFGSKQCGVGFPGIYTRFDAVRF